MGSQKSHQPRTKIVNSNPELRGAVQIGLMVGSAIVTNAPEMPCSLPSKEHGYRGGWVQVFNLGKKVDGILSVTYDHICIMKNISSVPQIVVWYHRIIATISV